MSAGIRRGLARGASVASGAVAAAIVLSPRALLACAVCTSGRDDESNAAFLVSTIFLSLLPLGALGTLVYVLWRRFQKLEQASGGAGVTGDRAGAPVAPIR